EVGDHGLDAFHLHVDLARLDPARSHEHELLDALGVVEREADGDGAPHRVAAEAHLLDAERADHAAHVPGEGAEEVDAVLGLVAVAVVEEIDDERARAVFVEVGVVPLEVAVAARAGTATGKEEDRAVPRLADVVEMETKSALDLDVASFGDGAELDAVGLIHSAATLGFRRGWKRCPHSLI